MEAMIQNSFWLRIQLMMGLLLGLSACSPTGVDFESYVPKISIHPKPEAQLLNEHPIEVVVHRGANHLAPENTFAAAARAIELGVTYVEVDVHRSLDGVHYIIHDLGLGRTTSGWGPVRLRTSRYIDRLDAGSWFSEVYKGEKVPRLKEYLQWIKGKAKVYLDVKTANLEALVALVRELHMQKDTFFWFWNPGMAKELRELAPDFNLKINAHSPEEVLEAKKQYNAQIIECNVKEITQELVQVCRENNIRIMAYASSNTEEEFRAVIHSQADMVNLDKPRLYIEVLEADRKQNIPASAF